APRAPPSSGRGRPRGGPRRRPLGEARRGARGPPFGTRLGQDAQMCAQVRERTRKVLQLQG
ncbi:MAG: hypothetical protein ABF504_10370, partial [Komagataeibacter saccharivorans]|uniref:hypothetical protein n=1 Tax=Komagataeibacter saccharivorans TaxID=265959 RepID=UPI0039E9D5DF